jgi:hypothetical protein
VHHSSVLQSALSESLHISKPYLACAGRSIRSAFFILERRKQYMKTKLRRFTAVLSAMLCMICCVFSAVPAFADDTDSVFTEHIFSQLENTYPHSEYSYMVISYKPSNSSFTLFQCFVVSQSSKIFYNSSDRTVSTDGTFIDSFVHRFKENSCTREVSYGSIVYVDIKDFNIIYSDLPVYDGDAPIYTDPNAPPTPFTVDYSPALSEGMSRKGTLVAPGASNNGQEIESNGLNVRVTLTDEFIKLRDSYDELKDYTYEFVCYITTSPPEKSSYEKSVKNAVYTSLDYGKYMYTTSGVVDDVTDDNKEPTEWIKAEGINAGYIIGKGGSVKNVTINLENLDSSQFTADTKLYIVVYGRLTSLSVPTPDYFDLDNQGYLCNQGSLNTKQIVTVNADAETGEGTDVIMPDYYCVTSTAFNYKDYPEYKPKIFKNGAEMDTNKPFTDYLDKKLTPDYMYDYDMDKNGESGLSPDDFEKYEEQKNLDKNFGSVDFGLDSIKSVFDGSSDFFKFLTASIGILPTTFLTILISFFVVMLAICVVKWVLK